MSKLTKVYVGVDVSKNHLDFYIHPTGENFRIKNNFQDIFQIKKHLSRHHFVNQIVCEASGGYERLMLKIFAKNGYRTWCVDPKRIKAFIASEGIKFKTDANDAKMIALFATQKKCAYEKIIRSKESLKLQVLVKRRKQIVKMISDEKKRMQQLDEKFYKNSIKRIISLLEEELHKIETDINLTVKKDKQLTKKSKIIESIPGIGKTTANTLIALVPELGTVTDKQAAALFGVCPYVRQSGNFVGATSIYGGREEARHTLYMAALSASRTPKGFKPRSGNLGSLLPSWIAFIMSESSL